METIYVVQLRTGEYEDTSYFMVRAFYQEEKASAYSDRFNQALKDLGCHWEQECCPGSEGSFQFDGTTFRLDQPGGIVSYFPLTLE